MANYDELLLTVSNYNASKAQADEPEVIIEKVNSDTVLNFGLIAAGIAAISALVAKIISDNKVKKIIKNDETLSALVDKIENTKSKLADLRSEYLAVENDYSEKIGEYNEYAKIFGSKTVKFESITKVPEPTVEDPGHMKTVNTTTTRPNENFDPEKAKRYKALAKELNVLADKARSIRSEISREYAALQGYIKQIKKEVRKYKYASEDTVAQVNSKCDDFINDIDDFEEKLKKFPVVESVEEPEFDEDVKPVEEGASGDVVIAGAAITVPIFIIGAWLAAMIKLVKEFIKANRAVKKIQKELKAYDSKIEEINSKIAKEIAIMSRTSVEFEKVAMKCRRLSNQLKRAKSKEEFDETKKELLDLSKELEDLYQLLFKSFDVTRDKLETLVDGSKINDEVIFESINNINKWIDEVDQSWSADFKYFQELKKMEYQGDDVKESVDESISLTLSICEAYASEEITEDEYDILMSGF